MRIHIAILSGLLWLSGLQTGSAQLDHSPSGRILLQIDESKIDQTIEQLKVQGLTSIRPVCTAPIVYQAVVHARSSTEHMKAVEGLSGVLRMRTDRLAELRSDPPNDSLYSQQWNLDIIGAESAWDISIGERTNEGQEIVVALFDAGFDVNHPDLAAQIWTNSLEVPDDGIDNDANGYIDDHQGWSVGNDSDGHPIRRHGTEVAGVMSAASNNVQGVASVAYGASLLLVSNRSNQIFESDILEAIEYVRVQRELYNTTNGTRGAFVVALNLSLGYSRAQASEFPMICEAIDALGQQGVLTVNAVDNDNYDVDVFGDIPAVCPSPHIIAVTASRRDDDRVNFAAFGEEHVDLAAPGVDIYTTRPNGYTATAGTSVATPHVTGAVALVYGAANDELLDKDAAQTAIAVRSVILESVSEVEDLATEVATGGRLHLSNAVNTAMNYTESPTPEPLTVWVDQSDPTGQLYPIWVSSLSSAVIEAHLYDMAGRVVRSWRHSDAFRSGPPIRIGTLGEQISAGVYVLHVIQEGQEVSQTVVKW